MVRSCYTENQVNRLFKYYNFGAKKFNLLPALPFADLSRQLGGILKERTRQINGKEAVKRELLIPIYANGQRWALLYLHYEGNRVRPDHVSYIDPTGKLSVKCQELFPKAVVSIKGFQYGDEASGPLIIEAGRAILQSGKFSFKEVNPKALRQRQQEVLAEPTYYTFDGEKIVELRVGKPVKDLFALFGISKEKGINIFLKPLNDPRVMGLKLQRLNVKRMMLIDQLSKATGLKLTAENLLTQVKGEDRSKYQQEFRQCITLNVQLAQLQSGGITKRYLEERLSDELGENLLMLLTIAFSKNVMIWEEGDLKLGFELHREFLEKGEAETIHLLKREGRLLSLISEPAEEPNHHGELPPTFVKQLANFKKKLLTNPSRQIHEAVKKSLLQCYVDTHDSGVNAENRGDYKEALKHFLQEYAMAKQLSCFEVMPKRVTYPISLKSIGGIYRRLGELKTALHYLKQAWCMVSDMKQAVECLHSIAIVFRQQGEYTKALAVLQKCLNGVKDTYPEGHALLIDTYTYMATIHDIQGEYARARKVCRLALSQVRKLGVEQTSQHAGVLETHAIVCFHEAKYSEATIYYEQALSIQVRLKGTEGLHLFRNLNNLAKVYSHQGKLEEALSYSERVLAIKQKIYGDNHPETAMAIASIAGIFNYQKKYEIAIERYEKAFEMIRQAHIEKGRYFSLVTHNLANAYSEQRMFDKALPLYHKALESNMEHYGKDHPSVASTFAQIAKLYQLQGKHAQSLLFWKKCVAADRKLNPNHTSRVNHEIGLGIICLRLGFKEGDDQKAVKYFQEGREVLENVLVKDVDLIKKEGKKIEEYDLSGHSQLLDILSEIYFLLNLPEKAAKLYSQRAKSIEQRFPMIAFGYINKALSIYKGMKEKNQECFTQLELRAKIHHRQKRFSKAIYTLKKALIYCSTSEIQQKLSQWEKELKAKRQFIDNDLWVQLEHSLEKYYALKALYLADFAKDKKLSAEAKNRTTELIVSFRSLLDQCYRRFVYQCIYEKNCSDRRGQPAYFPLAKSKTAFVRRLKEVEVYCSKGKATLRDYPKCEEVLIRHQPFSYYAPNSNEKKETWKKSWLDKVTAIGNDSKHVRMTPQYLKEDFAESFGTLKLLKVRVQIEYIEPRLFPWTFVPYLEEGFSHREKVTLSRKIYTALGSPKAGIIGKKGRLGSIIQQLPSASKEIKKKIGHTLRFLKEEQLSRVISVILRCARQQAFLKSEPDAMVDLEKLIDSSFEGTFEILETLCAARKQPSFPPAILKVQVAKPTLTQQNITTLPELLLLHRAIKNAKPSQLLKAVSKVEKGEPYVSIAYTKRALKGLEHLDTVPKEVLPVSKQLKTLLLAQGLYEEGFLVLERTLDHYPNLKEEKALKTEKSAYHQKCAYIDGGIRSQLVHLESMLPKLKYLCLKAIADPADHALQNRINHEIVAMGIKVHHLLDQSITHFANTHLLPNGMKRRVKFPCVESKTALIRCFVEDGLWNTKRRSLKQYPKIFAKIETLQPFSKETWWSSIHALSLEGKHVGMHLTPTKPIVIDKNTKTIEEVYQVQCPIHRLYRWSFAEFCSPQLSENIFQRLTQSHFLTKGKINTKQTPVPFLTYVEALRKGSSQLKTMALSHLKRCLKGLKLTDQHYEEILNQLTYHLRKAFGDFPVQSDRHIPILEVLEKAIKETRSLIEEFFV